MSSTFSYPLEGTVAAHAGVDERAAFLTRTYTHLVGAVLAFTGLEVLLVNSSLADPIVRFAFGGSLNWLLVLGAFMVVGAIAEKWARGATSIGAQYAGLSLYVVAEAFLFLPLLYVAAKYSTPDVIPSAAVVTLVVFTGLTAVVFVTRKDFSFLRGILGVGALCAIGLIVAGAIFGFNLGVFFSIAMVGLAAGYVLYYTSQVLLHYRTTQHVAAALALFAAIALLFWYILRIFMSRRN